MSKAAAPCVMSKLRPYPPLQHLLAAPGYAKRCSRGGASDISAHVRGKILRPPLSRAYLKAFVHEPFEFGLLPLSLGTAATTCKKRPRHMRTHV